MSAKASEFLRALGVVWADPDALYADAEGAAATLGDLAPLIADVVEAAEQVTTQLDDAIVANVNGDWGQMDYDEWVKARATAEAALAALTKALQRESA